MAIILEFTMSLDNLIVNSALEKNGFIDS